ncbi:MAG: protein kinase, partial [Planctomycetales bacterium]|nr:protein kinase [Planctomycetales bacterium]
MRSCPTQDRLRQFIDGQLSDDDFASLDQHVEMCSSCQATLERLTGGSAVDEKFWHSGDPDTEAERAHRHLPDDVRQRLTQSVVKTVARGDSSTASKLPVEPSVDDIADFLPTRLGDYEIVREIGRGGMGVVYEAKQRSLDRIVALKVLPRNFFPSAASIARFRREARAASQLHHTNIVPIFEVGAADGVQYYSMQLIDGVNLSNLAELSIASPAMRESSVKRGTISDHRLIADVGRQVADALHYAHQRHIIHRDVKPSNLILDKEGVAWLADFGLAKQLGEDLTGTMEAAGTLRFMSPERFQGVCDQRSDVYSLGLTLYELLTGQRAFVTDDHFSLMTQIREFDPPSPGSINPAIPRDLDTIVRKAISKSADRRYQSAQELADDLARFNRGEPIMARKVSLAERAWLWALKRKSLAASLAAILFLIILTAIGSSIAAVHFRNQEQRQ